MMMVKGEVRYSLAAALAIGVLRFTSGSTGESGLVLDGQSTEYSPIRLWKRATLPAKTPPNHSPSHSTPPPSSPQSPTSSSGSFRPEPRSRSLSPQVIPRYHPPQPAGSRSTHQSRAGTPESPVRQQTRQATPAGQPLKRSAAQAQLRSDSGSERNRRVRKMYQRPSPILESRSHSPARLDSQSPAEHARSHPGAEKSSSFKPPSDFVLPPRMRLSELQRSVSNPRKYPYESLAGTSATVNQDSVRTQPMLPGVDAGQQSNGHPGHAPSHGFNAGHAATSLSDASVHPL